MSETKSRQRGRPALGCKAKRLNTLRLDPEVLDAFKATGPGWQSRINDVLSAALKATPNQEESPWN